MATRIAWLTRSLPDVPEGDAWLGPRERDLLAGLQSERRRTEWRLGRWTAKLAVAGGLGLASGDVEVLATPGGAPAAHAHDGLAPIALSLSHRGDRALAVVADAGCRLGCDLEPIAPRSDAFVSRWLSAAERGAVDAAGEDRDRVANLIWTAKEAAAKALGEGLRLDVREAVVELADPAYSNGAWRALSLSWQRSERIAGWWRDEPGWVMAVASEPGAAAPEELRSIPAHDSVEWEGS
jgi:phosphopantetheinyl transferase